MRVTITVRVQPDGYGYQSLADENIEVQAPSDVLKGLCWTEFVASLVSGTLDSAAHAEAEEAAEE